MAQPSPIQTHAPRPGWGRGHLSNKKKQSYPAKRWAREAALAPVCPVPLQRRAPSCCPLPGQQPAPHGCSFAGWHSTARCHGGTFRHSKCLMRFGVGNQLTSSPQDPKSNLDWHNCPCLCWQLPGRGCMQRMVSSPGGIWHRESQHFQAVASRVQQISCTACFRQT